MSARLPDNGQRLVEVIFEKIFGRFQNFFVHDVSHYSLVNLFAADLAARTCGIFKLDGGVLYSEPDPQNVVYFIIIYCSGFTPRYIVFPLYWIWACAFRA